MNTSSQNPDIGIFLKSIKEALTIHRWDQATLDIPSADAGLSVRVPFDQFSERKAVLVIRPLATGDSTHPIKLQLMVVASLKNFREIAVAIMERLYERYTNDPNSQGGCFLSVEHGSGEDAIMHIWWRCEFTPSDEHPLNTELLLKLFAYALAGYEVLFFALRTAELFLEHYAVQELAHIPTTTRH